MTFWTIDTLKSVMGGQWLGRGEQTELTGVCTDTREIAPGRAFIALKGERTDGHAYLSDAVRGGAAMLVIDSPGAVPAGGFERPVWVLHTPGTSGALLRLGAAYRRTLERTRVIAVGGSNGKTTTVRLIHSVLSPTLKGTHSPKSFNNNVGVPLTLLGAKRSDSYLIGEVGTNAPGEIAPLAAAVEPDIAVITSIGREHLEGLGSIAGVVQEEVALLTGLRAGGVAILNADAPGLLEAARPIVAAQRATLLTFGADPRADLRLTDVATSLGGTTFTLNGRHALRLPLPGRHNAYNAAAAVAVARRLGVDQAEIERALTLAQGPPMRLQRVEAGDVTFINDAYNANPESVLASLATLAEALAESESRRRVLVLGDMLEQGSHAPEVHREIGEAVGACAWADRVIFVGPHSGVSAEAARARLGAARVSHIADVAGAPGAVAKALRRQDVVLLKGSRAIGLERVIEAYSTLAASPDLLEPKPIGVKD